MNRRPSLPRFSGDFHLCDRKCRDNFVRTFFTVRRRRGSARIEPARRLAVTAQFDRVAAMLETQRAQRAQRF